MTISAWHALSICLLSALCLIGPCLWWAEFVESAVCHTQIRRAMRRALSAFTFLECCLWLNNDLESWAFGCTLVVNFWGSLDAILRYPVIHSFCSCFSGKQLILLTLKVMCYTYGFHDANGRTTFFVMALMLLVFAMPIMYISALPLSDGVRRPRSSSVVDDDLSLRTLHYFQHQIAETKFKCIRDRLTLQIARRVPLLRRQVIAVLPHLRLHLCCHEV